MINSSVILYLKVSKRVVSKHIGKIRKLNGKYYLATAH